MRVHRGHMAHERKGNITANRPALLDYSGDWYREIGFASATATYENRV
jgi:hypothetical protein